MRFRPQGTLYLLIIPVWFAAFAQGAQDLWALTCLFGWLTLTAGFIAIFDYQRGLQISLPFLALLSIMLFTFLLGFPSSFDLNTTRLELWSWFFCGVLFVLCFHFFQETRNRSSFILIGGLVVIPLLFAAWQQFMQVPYSSLVGHWAANATFTNSAVLAGFSLSWILLFWHFSRLHWIFLWLAGSSLLILLFARSWWAFISLIVGVMYYDQDRITRKLNQWHKQLMFWLAFTGIGIVLLSYRSEMTSLHAYHHMTDRIDWWATGFRMFCAHPWLGVGLGGYATAFPYYRSSIQLNTLYAHNFPIQILAETGLFGFTSLSLLGVWLFRKVRGAKMTPNAELKAYNATLLTIVTYSLTSIYLDFFIGKMMFFIIIALILSLQKKGTINVTRQTVLVVVLGLLLITPKWYCPFKASQLQIDGLQFAAMKKPRRATRTFESALAQNPFQDESYAALAHLYRDSYANTCSYEDLVNWYAYMHQAIRCKHDMHYQMELTEPLSPPCPDVRSNT